MQGSVSSLIRTTNLEVCFYLTTSLLSLISRVCHCISMFGVSCQKCVIFKKSNILKRQSSKSSLELFSTKRDLSPWDWVSEMVCCNFFPKDSHLGC